MARSKKPSARTVIETVIAENPKPKPKAKAAKSKTPPVTRNGPPKRRDTGKAEVERQEKIAEALDYRRQGYSYREIAAAMDQSAACIHKWVKEGLREMIRDAAEDVRDLELSRLDLMQQKLMEVFLDTPDPSYASEILRISKRRLDMMGIKADPNNGVAELADVISDKFLLALKADRPVLQPDGPLPDNPIL